MFSSKTAKVVAPDAESADAQAQGAVAEVRVLQTQDERDDFAGDHVEHVRQDGLNCDLGVGDDALVGQRPEPLHARDERLDDRARVQTAVAVGQEPAHFAVQRADEMPLGVAVLEYLRQVVRDQGAAPVARGQRVEELDRQVGDLRDLAEREAVDAELRVVERDAAVRRCRRTEARSP